MKGKKEIEMVQQEIKKEGMETIQQEYIPQFFNCCMGCRKVLDNPRKYCIFCISKRVKERENRIEHLKNEIRKEREENKQKEQIISEKLKEINKPTDIIAETQRLYHQTEQHEKTIKLLDVKEKDMLRECIQKLKIIHNDFLIVQQNVNELIEIAKQFEQLYSERSSLIQLQAFLKDQILLKQKQYIKMINEYLLINTIHQPISNSSSNNSNNNLNNNSNSSSKSFTKSKTSSSSTNSELSPRKSKSKVESISSSSSSDQFSSPLTSSYSRERNEKIVYRIINLVINCENKQFNSLTTANIFIHHLYTILQQYHQILYIPFNLVFEMKQLDEPSFLTRKNVSLQSHQKTKIIISSQIITFNDYVFKIFLDEFLFLYHTLFKTDVVIEGINYVDNICKILQYFVSF